MIFFLCFFSYLLGSIPFGLVFAKLYQLPDPRQHASGNIGASNMTRLGGKKIGLFTLLADTIKGIIPLLIAIHLFPDSSAQQDLVGFCAILGHCFSIFLRFSGGKGVATGAGILLIVAPWATLWGFVIWLGVFFISKITSLAALGSSLFIPLAIYAHAGVSPNFYLALAIAVLIFIRHRQNIVNLWQGKERSFRKKS